ncbi:MAG: RluA family pseudouridine synthase [Proteobacteria bacterium]|nr:RluA family pseudouridine synthase [Desulfobacteraceae bacterium]MBU3981827.1 RluA family pseudouridine synthase [Pseudomonadota bacterium]MBU4013777.1 RluA family pseudouridine synthase [Pseudomonadota bacterium]MBU4066785.1 RluA family pseudouridine synthase [Pseudomonadota bacterium]MBU4100517.1 RluA family pseudouridine synthase [Pseudomonadota bacterium]
MPYKGAFTILVNEHESGRRLDVIIASHISDCSRSFSASLIQKGEILVQGEVKKPGYRVKTGDNISINIPAPEPVLSEPEPGDIDILYEDKHIIVINKEPGLVVHPAPGHNKGTLVNRLLYHCPELEGIGGKLRPGIVHRLDKDTSGTIVAAKNDAAHINLAAQFESRKIKKLYLALVYGVVKSESGSISLPIGRHPSDRKKMSSVSRKSRSAETFWKVIERFNWATLLELDLKTGRTHQIRVHCAAINHPVLGDPVYGGKKAAKKLPTSVPRQMLHAWRLEFAHPVTGEAMSFESPIPPDMGELIEALRRNTQSLKMVK